MSLSCWTIALCLPLASRFLSLFHDWHIKKHFSPSLTNPMGFMYLCKHFCKSSGVKKSLTWSWGLYEAKRCLLRIKCCSAEVFNSHSLIVARLVLLLKFNTNKHNRCTLLSVPLFCIQSTRLLNCFLSSTASLLPHGQPTCSLPFLSPPEKEKQLLPVLQTPAFPVKQELRHFEIFYFNSLAVQSGNREQKEAFVFVVWFLKRNTDSSA